VNFEGKNDVEKGSFFIFIH